MHGRVADAFDAGQQDGDVPVGRDGDVQRADVDAGGAERLVDDDAERAAGGEVERDHAAVVAVGHQEAAAGGVAADARRPLQHVSLGAERHRQASASVEHRHAVGAAVRHDDVAVRRHRHVARVAEASRAVAVPTEGAAELQRGGVKDVDAAAADVGDGDDIGADGDAVRPAPGAGRRRDATLADEPAGHRLDDGDGEGEGGNGPSQGDGDQAGPCHGGTHGAAAPGAAAAAIERPLVEDAPHGAARREHADGAVGVGDHRFAGARHAQRPRVVDIAVLPPESQREARDGGAI